MHLNHPETISHPICRKKLSSTKLVPGARKVGDHCFSGPFGAPLPSRDFACVIGPELAEMWKRQAVMPQLGDVHGWAAGEQPGMEEGSATTRVVHSLPPTVKTSMVLCACEGI